MSYANDRLEFLAVVKAEGERDAPMYARLVLGNAATHQRLCEDYCNVPGFDPARIDAVEARIQRQVAKMGAGFGVVFQNDPRGATVKLTLPSGRTNDWAGDGWCVPVRSSYG